MLKLTRISSRIPLNSIPRYNFKRPFLSKESPQSEPLPENLAKSPSFDYYLYKQTYGDEMEKAQLVNGRNYKKVGYWLLACAGAVGFMIIWGGYTRLSNSGLSMTKWKPLNYSLPQSEKAWEDEFEHYKQFPEYQISNKGMSLEGFKKIYFVEWLHRAVGSSLGFLFGVPFAYYSLRGYLTKKMLYRCSLFFILGGSQGLIGWWMVKSGMKDKPDYQIRPKVSTYRLITHLSFALTIFSLLFWNGLTLVLKPKFKKLNPLNYASFLNVRRMSIGLIHLVALNLLTGATMAGIDAGKVFNTWPLMNGEFSNYNSVTFWNAKTSNAPSFLKRRSMLVAFFVCYQVMLGILTVLNQAPLHYASQHQGIGLATLTSTLYLLHGCRKPPASLANYIKHFK